MFNETLNVTQGVAQYWYKTDWFNAITQPYIQLIGQSAFALTAFFMIAGVVWIYSRSIAMTVVIMLLIGAMMAPALPGQARAVIYLAIMFSISYALFRVYKRGETGW